MYKNRLKYLREDNNKTQKDIANLLGVERGLYSLYETEYQLIPIKHLIKICDFFHVSLDYVFEFSYENSEIISTDVKKSAERLKLWRKENKITQEKLAVVLNTNRSVIANYERGRNYIATPFLYTICKKYKVSADYLMGRIDAK